MNKFYQKLTATDENILEKRAQIAATSTKTAYKHIIDKEETELNSLELELMNLEDLSRNDVTSLNPVGKDYNPNLWSEKVADTTVKIDLKKAKIKSISAKYKELFEDEIK